MLYGDLIVKNLLKNGRDYKFTGTFPPNESDSKKHYVVHDLALVNSLKFKAYSKL